MRRAPPLEAVATPLYVLAAMPRLSMSAPSSYCTTICMSLQYQCCFERPVAAVPRRAMLRYAMGPLLFLLLSLLLASLPLTVGAIHTSVADTAATGTATSSINNNHNNNNHKPPLVARHVVDTSASDNASSSLTFKILQLSDLHFSGDPNWPCRDVPWTLSAALVPCTEATMSALVDELLDLEQPDLVVFSGDNVQTFEPARRQLAVDAFTRGVEARGIPHAEILGNHDDAHGFAREDVLAMGMRKRFSYTQRGPTTRRSGNDSVVDGVGNYALSVQAPVDGAWGRVGSNVFTSYFLDSGSDVNATRYPHVDSRYDWIHDSQVELYRELSHALQVERAQWSGPSSSRSDRVTSSNHQALPLPLPAIMFFHIPLREYARASLMYWRRTGTMREKVEPSDVASSLLDALVDAGEVKATFAGHDHTNAYCLLHRGVQLCTGGGAGLGVAYGDHEYTRRARVIEWRVNSANERTLLSWKRLLGGDRSDSDSAGRIEMEVLYSEDARVRLGLVNPPRGDHLIVVALHLSALVVLAVQLLLLGAVAVRCCVRRVDRRSSRTSLLPTHSVADFRSSSSSSWRRWLGIDYITQQVALVGRTRYLPQRMQSSSHIIKEV